MPAWVTEIVSTTLTPRMPITTLIANGIEFEVAVWSDSHDAKCRARMVLATTGGLYKDAWGVGHWYRERGRRGLL